MEEGIKDEENKLYKQTEDVAENVLDNLDKPLKASNNTMKTSNNNYSFQFNIYPQKFDEKEMENILNYLNGKLGIEY